MLTLANDKDYNVSISVCCIKIGRKKEQKMWSIFSENIWVGSIGMTGRKSKETRTCICMSQWCSVRWLWSSSLLLASNCSPTCSFVTRSWYWRQHLSRVQLCSEMELDCTGWRIVAMFWKPYINFNAETSCWQRV